MSETIIKLRPPMAPVDALVNLAQEKLGLRTKTETIKIIGANPSKLSRMRSGQLRPTAEFILRFYDATGIPIEVIRSTLQIQKS